MLPDIVSESLPQAWGFLRNYVEYAAACSDAPEIYHVGVGMTVLAAAIAKKVSCPWLAGRTLVPNLYTLLVGPSRSSRKSACMDTGIDLLGLADPSLVMPIPGSYEELISQIRQKSEGLLTYREFGHFLKTTQRGYGEPIRTVLMDLYDWPPDRPYTRNLTKGKTVIEAPICLSMLASIATDLLFAYTDGEEWTGGFFGRMVVLYGERASFKMPMTWPHYRGFCANGLAAYVKTEYPQCGGFMPDAWALFDSWSRWRDERAISLPDRVQTFIAGTGTLGAKVALLYAIDSGDYVGGTGWMVSRESVYRAINFVEKLYIPSIMYLGEQLALGTWERDRKRVFNIITKPGRLGISRRDLLKSAKISSEYLDTIAATLKEEGSIIQANDTRGVTYRIAMAGEVGMILPFARVLSGDAATTDDPS